MLTTRRFLLSGTVAALFAFLAVGVPLALGRTSDGPRDVPAVEAAQIAGGQSSYCGTSTGSSAAGCNLRCGGWKFWQYCTTSAYWTGTNQGQNSYVAFNCNCGCGAYCGSYTQNWVCGINPNPSAN
jgi:hypothetical protein